MIFNLGNAMQLSELGYLGKAIMQQLVSFFSQLQRVSATVLSDEITMLCSSTAKSPEPCSVAVALNAIGRSKVTALALGYLGKAIMQQLVSFFSQLQRVSATVLSDEITMLCSSTAKSPEPCSVAVALNAIGRSKVTALAQATNISALYQLSWSQLEARADLSSADFVAARVFFPILGSSVFVSVDRRDASSIFHP